MKQEVKDKIEVIFDECFDANTSPTGGGYEADYTHRQGLWDSFSEKLFSMLEEYAAQSKGMRWVKGEPKAAADFKRLPIRYGNVYDTIQSREGRWCYLRGEQVNNGLVSWVENWDEFEYLSESTQEGGTVEAELLLANEIFNKYSWAELGAISPSKRICIPAMVEYASQVSATDKKRIDELLKEQMELFRIRELDKEQLERYKQEVERLRGLVKEAHRKGWCDGRVENEPKESWEDFKGNNNL